jgi:hypothetical protein
VEARVNEAQRHNVPPDEVREFLLKEYDAAREMLYMVEERRYTAFNYFIAFVGFALAAMALAQRPPGEDTAALGAWRVTVRWVVGGVIVVVGSVTAFVVSLVCHEFQSILRYRSRMNAIRKWFRDTYGVQPFPERYFDEDKPPGEALYSTPTGPHPGRAPRLRWFFRGFRTGASTGQIVLSYTTLLAVILGGLGAVLMLRV